MAIPTFTFCADIYGSGVTFEWSNRRRCLVLPCFTRLWLRDNLHRPSALVYADSFPSEKVLGRGVVTALMVMDCGSDSAIGITPRAVVYSPIGV
jgi:hypothetical protein